VFAGAAPFGEGIHKNGLACFFGFFERFVEAPVEKFDALRPKLEGHGQSYEQRKNGLHALMDLILELQNKGFGGSVAQNECQQWLFQHFFNLKTKVRQSYQKLVRQIVNTGSSL
jgi:hypothetical protein